MSTSPTAATVIRAPYGSWPSPLGVGAVLAGSVSLSELVLDGDDVYWLERRPSDEGRTTLVRWRAGSASDVTQAPASVVSRVNEYGGGAYDAHGGWIVWCDDTQGRLIVRSPLGHVQALTRSSPDIHFGGLRIHPDAGLVTAVLEDHAGAGEPRTSLVGVPIPQGPGLADAARPVPLAAGADFYACCEMADDGRIAWMEWDHPNMPWDSTRLRLGRLDTSGSSPRIVDSSVVDGGPAISCQYPRFAPDGRLTWMSDRRGFWQPWILDADGPRPLTDAPSDHCQPLWQLDNAVQGFPTDHQMAVPRTEGGRDHIVVLSPDTPEQHLLDDAAVIESLVAGNGQIWAIAGFPDRPAAVVHLDLTDAGQASASEQTIRSASPEGFDPAVISAPRALTVPGPNGDVHAWYFPPSLAGYEGPVNDLPPVIVRTHGGPTAMAGCALRPSDLFWTSRGVGVVWVDYAGSSGYGRAYRDRLRGQWGVADVADCVAVVRAVVDQRLADPQRIAIAGGSAGGYTTLQALVTTDVFSAGMSRYGIGDLAALEEDTHKFEAHYTEGLVGPWPAARQTYRDRSPIHHVDRLATPMLLLQGAADKVVPPNQAVSMADAVRRKHLPVALVMFEGEGHGFRRPDTMRRALEAELSFLSQVFGFAIADDIPTQPIENLG